MTSREQQLYAVFTQVRTCFNHLKTLAEELHVSHGVNPSMRAVMESLANGGPQTVPEIAKSKGVSRQHIQNVMNALYDDGFVLDSENPAHKRSPLFRLTNKGDAAFKEIQDKEKVPLKKLAKNFSTEELVTTKAALEKIIKQVEAEISKGKPQ